MINLRLFRTLQQAGSVGINPPREPGPTGAPASRHARGTDGLQRRAEALAGPLPPLLLAAHRVATTVEAGWHGRRRIGTGETFWQFRRYQAGDPVGRVDWRQSARRQAVHVRDYEWETAQTVWLWRDGSRSMDYRSASVWPTKRTRAEVLLLALAILLRRGGERFGLLGGRTLSSGRGTALEALARALTAEGETDAARVIGPEAQGTEATSGCRWPINGFGLPPLPLPARDAGVVLWSDFWVEPAALRMTLAGFGSRRIRGHLIQVVDPAELAPPFRGRMQLDGLEGEASLLVPRFESSVEAYQTRLAAHQAALADTARAAGWRLIRHRTDAPPAQALLAIVNGLRCGS